MGRFWAAITDITTSREAGFGILRKGLLSKARGRVLELGAGTGANFPFYSDVTEVVATEPDEYMLERARKNLSKAAVAINIEMVDAQSLPYAGETFDTVVGTLVFCTIPDPDRALTEAKRVLKPGGRLLLIEHIRGPDSVRGLLEDLISPLWKVLAGGCHINRNTVDDVRGAGFMIVDLKSHFKGLQIVEIYAQKQG